MCCIAEIASLVFGIITLATGKFRLTRNKVVYGAPARIVGGLLVAPLPVALAVGMLYGIVIVAGKGGGQTDILHPPTAMVIAEVMIFLVFFSAAMIVAMVNAGPPKRKPRRPIYEDELEEDDDDFRRERDRRYPEDEFRE